MAKSKARVKSFETISEDRRTANANKKSEGGALILPQVSFERNKPAGVARFSARFIKLGSTESSRIVPYAANGWSWYSEWYDRASSLD